MNKSQSTMERSSSTATDSGFWTTIELLMSAEWRERPAREETEVTPPPRPAPRRRRSRIASLASEVDEIPIPMTLSSVAGERARGARLMAARDPPGLMQQIQERHQRGRELSEEALQRRIAAREMDEMDRLKRLILSGKSPLKDCPPELKGHPVFVFWGLVNKEVEKMSKARADAYYKKLRRPRRRAGLGSQGASEDMEESSLGSLASQADIPEYPVPPPRERRQGVAFAGNFKYEDEGVKELRKLTTVEELYQMADQIIGIPRDADMDR